MHAPQSLHWPVKRLTDLRVLAKFLEFLIICPNRATSFFAIFPKLASTSGFATIVYVIQRWP